MEPSAPMKETVDLRSYARMVWRRKWVVIIPAVLAVAAGFIITLPAIMRPVYESGSTLMVEFPQSLSQGLASLVANPSIDEQMARLTTEVQSTEFLTRLIGNTGLRDDASVQEWARKNRSRYPDLSIQDLVDLKLIEYLRRIIHLTAGPSHRGTVNAGNLIAVSVQDYYPERARRLVQNITAGVIEANRSEQLQDAKSTGDFSATQLQEYQSKLHDAEERLERYKREIQERKVQPALVTEQTVAQVRELREAAASDLKMQEEMQADSATRLRAAGADPHGLDAILDTPDITRMMEEARSMELDFVRRSIIGLLPGAAPSQSGTILLARKVEEIRSALKEILAEKKVPSAGLEAAEAYLLARVRADLAKTRQDAFDGQIARYTSSVTGEPQADLEFQRLQEEVDSYRALQNTFLQQLASSQISEAFGSSKVGEKISVLEPAEHPLEPIRPKRRQIILLAVLAGLAVGVVGAFFLEHHDPSFRDVRDVEGQSGLRVLGTVPDLHRLARLADPGRRSDPVLHAAAVERAAEEFLRDSPGYQEFRKLVLDLLRPATGGPRSLMLTSARRGEGKSTSSACIALAMAKEIPGEQIVLVDLDIRNPTLGGFFGLNGKAEDAGVDLGPRRWTENALQELPLVLPNLRLVTPNTSPTPGAEIVTGESVRWLLGRLAPAADRIIIDAPPNLPVPDALVIGQEVDGVIVVVRAGTTPRETVRRGIELQRQFKDNVLGILLNNCSEVLPYYYHHKHYGHGYAYSRR